MSDAAEKAHRKSGKDGDSSTDICTVYHMSEQLSILFGVSHFVWASLTFSGLNHASFALFLPDSKVKSTLADTKTLLEMVPGERPAGLY
jgi:hypothetical protein